jgi:ferredoxin
MFKVEIDEDRCSGCGNCIVVCPVNAVNSAEVSGGRGPPEERRMGVASGTVNIYEDFCTGCGNCMKTCAYDAIEVHPPEQEEGSRFQRVDEFIYGRKREAYELIKTNGPMTILQVAEALGIPPKEAATYINTLRNEGKLWEHEKIDAQYTYSTEAVKRVVEEVAGEEVAPKVPSEVTEKIRRQLDSVMKSFNEVKIRFLLESDKLDRAKEELTRKGGQ